MKITPDETILWEHGFITINLTLVITWALMLVMIVGAILITRNLKTNVRISRWQCILEMLVIGINNQIKEIGLVDSGKYIAYLG